MSLAALALAADEQQELIDRLRLSLVSGIGPRLRQALLERFGSPAGIWAASREELESTPGIGRKLSMALRAALALDVAAEVRLAQDHGIDLLTDSSAAYPRLLRELPDPPGLLYVNGSLTPADALCVAIVGSRHATAYGLRQAERFAAGLARCGITIVSGLARGVDAAAHRGALGAGGRTLAVLGSGLLNLYPEEHAALATEITHSGAILSEYKLHSAPLRGNFPARNRIISGIALGVLVIEAADTSGSLITARLAGEQGRDVFALPGRVDSRMSRGCHALLRDGARLVTSPDDVLEELGPLVEAAQISAEQEVHHPAELLLNEREQQVLFAIGNEPTSIDQVVSSSGLATPQVLATLSVLEMRRLIQRHAGSQVSRR